MDEGIRLVIWDLDETFWSGTLTEGGIHYERAAHDIVVELCRRGIMSSICSRNSEKPVRDILIAEGLWDFFIFPSINWESKGHRVARIIEDVQLRAPSVLFIDDNPLNLHEALGRVPGLQIAVPELLTTLLKDPRFKGRQDPEHARLKQYKVLERRQSDRGHGEDNLEFLRSSGIRIVIDEDIDAHLDRAVELINRTNQLNFTKRRLVEDVAEARLELVRQLRERNVQAGLVQVTDNYGDYGFAGFYLLHVHEARLSHFCFSCRTLGLGVERWLYERLGRPALAIVGEPLSDLYATQPVIDWINQDAPGADKRASKQAMGRVFVRGGCEMQSLAHYFALDAERVDSEFAFARGGLPMPLHHSVFLSAAIEGLNPAQVSAAASLGYVQEDFASTMAADCADYALYVFSFWADALYSLYQDRDSGLRVPFGLHEYDNGPDVRLAPVESLRGRLTEPGMSDKLGVLREHFDYVSWSLGIDEPSGRTLFEENLTRILGACATPSTICVLLACETVYDAANNPQSLGYLAELNRLTRGVASGFPNAYVIDPLEFVRAPSDIIDATHFDRRLYHRIYQRIAELHHNHRRR